MKRLLYIFAALLALAALSCKEKDNPVTPGGGGEGGGDVEISSISIPASLSMDVDWTGGMLLEVTLSPSGASLSDVAASIESGEDVISIEKAAGGFQVKPKKIGEATVKVSATSGPADPKTCAVKVTAPGVSNATELETITLGQTSIELTDLTTAGVAESALIPVTLSPSNAVINDVTVTSSDENVTAEMVNDNGLKLKISIPSNVTHAATNVRTATVTVKAKKGQADSRKVTVGIRGHVTGLSFTVPSNYLENGEVHFTYGEKVKLNPTLTKTGTLKSGGDKINYTCGSGVSVTSDNEIYSLSESSVTGASKSTYVKAQCGFSETTEFKVHTYAVPTGITISSGIPEELGNTFKVGTNYILTVTVTPSTARQYVTPSCSLGTDYLTISDTYNTGKKFDIVPKKSTQSQGKLTFKSGTKIVEWSFHINDYLPGDVKVGDYVYRTSSGGISRSDGGLRAVGNGQAWIRKEYVNSSVPSGGELIGIIFDPSPSFIESLPSNMKAGIKGNDGVAKHVGVVAVQDAATGNSAKTCTWGNSTISWGGDSNTPKSTVSNTYKLYTLTYAKGTAVTFNSLLDNFKNTLKLPSSGTTPWMLPGCIDFEQMSTYGEVLFKNKAGLSGSYWTACTDGNSSQAWAATWDSSKYTFSLGQYPRANAHKLRPVFFL